MPRRVVRLPARMKRVATVLTLAAFVAPVLSGCARHHEVPEPEGQNVKVDGLTYTVFITRELNLRDPADHDYYQDVPLEWGRQWPAEEIWRARKTG